MSKEKDGQTVLVTGGSGFLGQHIIRELQIHDPNVKEIRVLDIINFSKKLDYASSKPVISFVADIRNLDSCRDAFRDVDCVFHCAAVISYEFPPDMDMLYEHNVKGTENVIQLCLEQNVKNLVFTSTTETVFTPYMRSTMAIMVYKTEARATPPESRNEFLIPGYPETKLMAEKLILAANGRTLKNGSLIRTVALRPTFLYGEEDQNFLLPFCKLAQTLKNRLFRVFGSENKQQVTYAGNAAWAHITAKNTLIEKHEKISGLPVFITDDTTIEDNISFLEKLTKNKLKATNWWIPAMLTYIIAVIIEIFVKHVSFPLFKSKLPYSLTSLVSYCSSVILFNRLRASIHLDYTPIYSEEVSLSRSQEYYINQLKVGLCNRFKYKRNVIG